MVTNTAFPMEPSKQCKRGTTVHYQSEILHKIPIQDQQGSLGWHSFLRKGTHATISLCKLFLRPFTPYEDNYQEQQQVICTDHMLETDCFWVFFLHFAQEKEKSRGWK